jgi:lysophospholipase L1-like esterase
MLKRLLLFAALLSLFSFNVKKAKNVLFLGDSITEAGVAPGGYISLLSRKLSAQGNHDYNLIGAGVGGNKVYDLYLRLEDDVLSKSPDIVVIYVGVNDVWHKKLFGTGTDPEKFEKFYRAIIRKIEAAGAKVIVCTPATIGERNDYSNQMDGDLNRYSNIIRNLAAELKLPVVDLRKLYTDYEKVNNPGNAENGILTIDGVHMNDKGNQFLAEQMWNVIRTQ